MSEKFKSSIELEVARYYPTQRLNLYSYKPVDPYGVKGYIPNPLPADLPPGWVRGFDPTNLPPTPDVVLEIVRPLSAGKKKRAQITVCKTLQHLRSHDSSVHGPRKGGIWPELIVCKSFDAVFFPPFPGCSADKMADKALSRENGAYRHLYAKNFTGFPHITPEFYGSYVAVFDLGLDEQKRRVYRCASVILMEHPITDCQKLPNPMHPSELFNVEFFTHWLGWWPSSYCYKTQSEDEDMEIEYARNSNGDLVKDEDGHFLLRNEVEFEVWMLKVWGPRKEGRYSVGETLDQILSDEEKKDKENFLATEPEAAAEADALMLALGLRKPKSDADADDQDRPRSQ
ncbi:hypothetical protein K4K55_006661 [Colletotrichum sp. SAR 10_96]|nr:hypothetical protein K4K55_006661 [Colletotrichum sp. SAR 10_96]